MTRETIDICICTFRRPSLEKTLASIAAQELPSEITVRVIVADNDTTDQRRAEITSKGRELALDLLYVHAPERNISIARNACLDAATNDWIAFIDDDEEAAPDWIAALLTHRAGADIVFGVSQARYPDPRTPQWVIDGDFHSNRIAGNDAPWNGYTANVLIDRGLVQPLKLRFAVELGQIGGEDTAFFLTAYRAGARYRYAPRAIVYEDTPLGRARFSWLALRRYRSGQVHAMLLADGRIRAAFSAATKAGVCFARAAVCLPRPNQARREALRGMLHAGVVASSLGFAAYREYHISAEPGTSS